MNTKGYSICTINLNLYASSLKNLVSLTEEISMEIKRCFVCMYQGLMKVGTNTDSIYSGSDERHIQLCYSHSVELFRTGQKKFMTKYRENFTSMEFDTIDFSNKNKRSVWY